MTETEIVQHLFVLIQNRKEEAIIDLVEKHPFLLTHIITGRETGLNLFLYACHKNFKTVLRYLVEKGVDIHSVGAKNFNAFHYANNARDVSLFQYLYELGININHVGQANYTPLLRACAIQNKEIIDFLIEKGADVNAESDYHYSLISAYKKGMDKIELSYLMKHFDKFNEKNQKILKGLQLKTLVTKGATD